MTRQRFHRAMEMIHCPPLPVPGGLKPFLFQPLVNKVQNKGMQGVRARYDAGLSPFISTPRHPGRPVIVGMDNRCKRPSLECSFGSNSVQRRVLIDTLHCKVKSVVRPHWRRSVPVPARILAMRCRSTSADRVIVWRPFLSNAGNISPPLKRHYPLCLPKMHHDISISNKSVEKRLSDCLEFDEKPCHPGC